MVSFKSLLLAASALTGALARPFDFLDEQDDGNSTSVLEARQVTGNSEGYHNGYFYSWWSDGGGYANYRMGEGSHYQVDWRNTGNFVGGKGWNPGTGRTINYGGSFSPQGNGYLCVYGWTRSPLVESLRATALTTPALLASTRALSTTTATPTISTKPPRVQQPSIDGIQTFNQYWAIRRNKRTSGAVNMQTIFNAWNSAGMRLGNHYYQILATEGYQSSGSSSIYVQTK
ncbi:Glycoside hydrolase family 11 [Fusarium oxysporum f. sp. vasinfectum]|nr:Glycoside hydrolase family 11 [Fusarium oxysporum f. sp. vasinfectum]